MISVSSGIISAFVNNWLTVPQLDEQRLRFAHVLLLTFSHVRVGVFHCDYVRHQFCQL